MRLARFFFSSFHRIVDLLCNRQVARCCIVLVIRAYKKSLQWGVADSNRFCDIDGLSFNLFALSFPVCALAFSPCLFAQPCSLSFARSAILFSRWSPAIPGRGFSHPQLQKNAAWYAAQPGEASSLSSTSRFTCRLEGSLGSGGLGRVGSASVDAFNGLWPLGRSYPSPISLSCQLPSWLVLGCLSCLFWFVCLVCVAVLCSRHLT